MGDVTNTTSILFTVYNSIIGVFLDIVKLISSKYELFSFVYHNLVGYVLKPQTKSSLIVSPLVAGETNRAAIFFEIVQTALRLVDLLLWVLICPGISAQFL